MPLPITLRVVKVLKKGENDPSVNIRHMNCQHTPQVRSATLRIWLTAASLWLAATPVLAAEDSVTDDNISMIIFAPRGPVLAELSISVGGKPYRVWVAEFLSRRLDVDQSGGLSSRELGRIPERLALNAGFASATDLATQAEEQELFAKNDAGVQQIERDKFNAWFSQLLSRSMQVVAQGVPPSEAVRLGELLDTGGNGSVGPDELKQGLQTLRLRDLDDDQTLSATELLPFRDPRNQLGPVTPDAADLPFIQLTDEGTLTKAAERVALRYGGEEQAIPFSKLRTHPQLLAPFDEDNDRALNVAEFRNFLNEPSAHLAWEFQLAEQSGRSRIAVKASPYARRFCKVKQLRRGQRSSLEVDDMPIEVRSHGGSGSTRRALIGFLGQHFSVSDEDRDGLLTEDEFGKMSSSVGQAQLTINFKRADIDEDEHLSRDEMKAWIETDTLATQSQIEVSVKQDGKTMFSLLDTNFDRRLAQRELQEGQSVLQEYDVNQDGELAESELGTRYVLQIGLGQPEWQRQSPQMINQDMMSTDAILPGIESLKGPQWFRRMDRNQDGDLSRREFLGTRQQFDQLDTDGDSLVDAEEAEATTQ